MLQQLPPLQTNELVHALLTDHTLRMLYRGQNGTRQHYATLPGSTASYGKCTQTHTLKNRANLLAYMADGSLYIPENGFQGDIRCQGGPLSGFVCTYC